MVLLTKEKPTLCIITDLPTFESNSSPVFFRRAIRFSISWTHLRQKPLPTRWRSCRFRPSSPANGEVCIRDCNAPALTETPCENSLPLWFLPPNPQRDWCWGSMRVRSCAPARMSVNDPAAALIYVRENLHEAIKTVETLDRTAYLHQAGTTGELLPGIESVPSREAFSLRFFGKDGTE